MLQCSNEDNSAGKQLIKMRKLEVAITPQAHVLHLSNRHNLQTSIGNQAIISKGKSTSKKTDVKHTLNQLVEINEKQPAAPLSRRKEENLHLKLQDSTNSSEIEELKRRLHNANLQIAEVVAQSAILVRDVECAASKKIEDALRYTPGSESKRDSASLLYTQMEKGFDHVGAGTSEQELAVTRQELADCKCMLAVMRKQLERTSHEKEKLETYLRSSVETSLKLQSTLANQRAIMQLELLAVEDRCRSESAGLVQSARNEAEHLQDQLDAARFSKSESDCLLRDCIQMLCYAQRELWQSKVPYNRRCCFQSAVQEKYQQLQKAQEQVQMQRDSLHEAFAESAIIWTVLECMWEGAVQSSLDSGRSIPERIVHVETPNSTGRKWKQPRSNLQNCFYSSAAEDPTPLKSRTFIETPRSKSLGDEEHRGLNFEVSHPEEVLRQSLIKSEHEVEILGDKVDELRVILEKVTSLLDCISKSSVTGHETKVLMRRIIEQLQTFEM